MTLTVPTMKHLKYLPAILWMVLIFYMSSKTDLPSVNNYFWEFIFKKSGHVFVYFILTLIWIWTLSKEILGNSILLSFAYAFIDEIHQLFVPGRTGLLRDVYIDLLGILLAVLLFFLLKKWTKRSIFPPQMSILKS